MQIGFVGLGRMGGNMVERLREAGHDAIGYDRNPDVADVASLDDLVKALSRPRVIWVMVPAGDPTRATVEALGDVLDAGDIVIDGGNSRWSDDRLHAAHLAERGIGFLDVGVSGGVWGRTNGYALMVGGAPEHVELLRPIFASLKPPGEFGFVHAGDVGAGHFAKMVHNGIEYGMMQSFAEGYELLQASAAVHDVAAVVKSWRSGTVIQAWLLDLLDRALDHDSDLSELRGYVEDSGEGRWTVEAAIEHGVPLPAITAALFARFTSRQEDSPAMKVVAALRNQFGGHQVAASAGSFEKGADAPGADVEPPVESEASVDSRAPVESESG